MSKGPKYREPQSFKWNHNFRIIMDAVESYARSWARTEGVDHNILSEWTKTVRNLVKRRVYILRNSMATRYRSVFNDKDVSATLSDIHDTFVVVPADKASNNVVFVVIYM